MRIVVKNVGEKAEVREVENELEVFQQIVGGYIEVFPVPYNMLLVLNEEGKLQGLPKNFDVVSMDSETGECCREIIVGNVAFVSMGYDDFEGLSDEQIQVLYHMGILA